MPVTSFTLAVDGVDALLASFPNQYAAPVNAVENFRAGNNAAEGDLDFGSFKGVNVADPTAAQDAATKAYVDAVASSYTVVSTGISRTAALGELVIVTAGGTTQTLPTAVGFDGQDIVIKRRYSGTPTTIDTTGGQTIDGNLTVNLNSDDQSERFASDGANWVRI